MIQEIRVLCGGIALILVLLLAGGPLFAAAADGAEIVFAVH